MVSTIRNNNVKLIVCALLLGIFLGFTSIMAYAVTAYSDWKNYGPVNGYSYKNRAIAYSDLDMGVSSRVVASTADLTLIPVGYMGVRPYIYKHDGQLMWTGSWAYNSNEVYSIIGSKDVSSGVAIYSKGYTAAYNGDGYNTYSTYQSPTVNPY